MLELSMHIMDIVENSVAAGATEVAISVREDQKHDELCIEIRDDGRGMDGAMVKEALDPFVTTKKGKRVGLGLSMLAEAARKTGGGMKVDSGRGKGTVVRVTFGLSHMDRQPLGDFVETMITLIVGNPGIEFLVTHEKDSMVNSWSTGSLREVFGDVFRSHPDVVDFIRGEMSLINSKIKN